MSYDLTDFDTKTQANAGVEVELLSVKDGSRTGMFITVLGSDSDAYQTAMLERKREVSRILEERGTQEIPAEEGAEFLLTFLARMTIGWRNVKLRGALMEFSTDKARDVYASFPAIREQVNVAIVNRRLFLKA